MFFINSHSFSTYTVNIFSQLYSLDADTFSFISSKCMNVFYKSEKMLYKQLMLDCVGQIEIFHLNNQEDFSQI